MDRVVSIDRDDISKLYNIVFENLKFAKSLDPHSQCIGSISSCKTRIASEYMFG